MASIEVKVPDIGEFKDVEVIEVLVKPGDAVAKEQSLITLESDKATMEIPSPGAGVVMELRIKTGDKVSQGSPILILDSAAAAEKTPPKTATPPASASPASPAASAGVMVRGASQADLECDVVVLGAGPGGYSAAFRAADLGLKTVLVERYPVLGGVCLNVGCIPSKALLHTAAVMDAARALGAHGIAFGEPRVDLAKLRAFKDKVVGKLTGGLAAMAKMRKVTVLQGVGSFIDAHHLKVEDKIVHFASAIVAAGSQAAKLPFLPDDARIVDSTGALALRAVPKRMLVIGGGIIGLEMATVYSTLGARLEVVEMMDALMPGADRDLVAVWQKFNAARFDSVMLGTKTTKAEATKEGIRVSFDKGEARTYDMILVSVGRVPNGKTIGAEKAGVEVDSRGFVPTDGQMRTNVPHVYAIGDVARNPMLAHKAVHEGHVAAEAAAGKKSHFDARVIPSVAYTDPEIAWVGLTEEEAKKTGAAIGVAKFPWSASGRAIANARDEGFTKLLFDAGTHRVLGGGIVGTGAGDLISEIALAIEMGADATDIGSTIHPHPTLSESVGFSAEAFEGVCTDLPPQRKK
ncbi:MAG: dihydrolipoyl dehydrogenase [Betaproteobacteria bacterium RIFCSPLOWO2_12_FULL_68_19]|nr:MAG: dihydrolipoyl dehydrogenase [Betaproteobacteria bacterium RIFCSPLOWO2_12_FULL_68_19]